MGSNIQRIYQTLVVEFPNTRVNQVYIKDIDDSMSDPESGNPLIRSGSSETAHAEGEGEAITCMGLVNIQYTITTIQKLSTPSNAPLGLSTNQEIECRLAARNELDQPLYITGKGKMG